MKKLLILGILLLSSCSAYRIRVNETETQTYYTPSQRVGLHWVEHYASFQNKELAEWQIQNWKLDKAYQKRNKSQYIYFK
jgi:hypothetical protein